MRLASEAVVGMAKVSGGTLRYRLLRADADPAARPVLVFENGWGAPHEQWAWVERELRGFATLLFYSHAGVGGSTLVGAQTAAGLSQQLADLLQALGITPPVMLVGHSFGGLMCALHAAQRPDLVAGLVQLDNTPEVNDARIDGQGRALTVFCGIAMLCARLGLRDPLFAQLRKTLPAEEGERMQRLAFGSVTSLQASLAEYHLSAAIRAAIAARPLTHPRLVISANHGARPKSAIGKWLAKPEKMREMMQLIHSLHQAQARASGGRWMTLAHSHGDLVFTAAGAADSAREIRAFAATLAR